MSSKPPPIPLGPSDPKSSREFLGIPLLLWTVIAGGITAVVLLFIGIVFSARDTPPEPVSESKAGDRAVAPETHPITQITPWLDSEGLEFEETKRATSELESHREQDRVQRNHESARDAPKAEHAEPETLTPQQIYDKTSSAVLLLKILNDDEQEIGTGTGFYIAHSQLSFAADSDAAGYILTNYHVIENAVEVTARTNKGLDASILHVVLEDKASDLALLRAKFQFCDEPLQLSTGPTPDIGTQVYAIGNPQGLANSLSEGIISGKREMPNGGEWLQTTAAISPGSSGSPLLTPDGKVVAVVTASRRSGQNLNFAVPAPQIKRFLNRLIAKRHVWKGASHKKEYANALDQIELDRESVRRTLPLKTHPVIRSFLDARITPDWAERVREMKGVLAEFPTNHRYLVHADLGETYYLLAWKRIRPFSDPNSTGEQTRKAFQNSKDYRSAISSLNMATKLKPDFATSYARLVEYQLFVGEIPEALIAADRLVQLVPRCSDAYKNRAECFSLLKRYSKARDDLVRAIELNSRNSQAHRNLGHAYRAMKMYEEALREYKIAYAQEHRAYIRGGKETGIFNHDMAITYRDMGKYGEAIAKFEIALSNGFPFKQSIARQIEECRRRLRK